MAMTTIRAIEWNITSTGRLLPRIHFDPVTFEGKTAKSVFAYNANWVFTNGLGVGALICMALKGTRFYITHNNFPMVPDMPAFCRCGIRVGWNGLHLTCVNEGCTFSGGEIILDQPISSIKASIFYAEIWAKYKGKVLNRGPFTI